jgi:hypothetical protein
MNITMKKMNQTQPQQSQNTEDKKRNRDLREKPANSKGECETYNIMKSSHPNDCHFLVRNRGENKLVVK